MRIAQIHNKYKQLGGEDVVVNREKRLLEQAGHTVFQFFASNKDLDSGYKKVNAAFNIAFSIKHKQKVKKFLKKTKPDIVHVHNFLPILTASIFYAAKEEKLPIVLTIHNFRLLCINGLLFRSNDVCEKCIPLKVPIHGIKYGCYQNSKIKSIFPALANGIHNLNRTWYNKIDKVIFLTEFSKSVFERSALKFPEQMIEVKPNFVEDYGFELDKEDYYLFVGRLSEEKGIITILEAFQRSGKQIKIAGDGPLKDKIAELSKTYSNIELIGFCNQEELAKLYKRAKALIFGSHLYEGMGLVIVEAFSYGTPVIAPKLGNALHLVSNKENGMLYKVKDSIDLNKTIQKFEKLPQMSIRQSARAEFKTKYDAKKNYTELINIYKKVLPQITNK